MDIQLKTFSELQLLGPLERALKEQNYKTDHSEYEAVKHGKYISYDEYEKGMMEEEGYYKDGEKDGQGIYISLNGEKYIGDYKEGFDWNGTYFDKNGNIKSKCVNGERLKESFPLKSTPSSPMSNHH